MSKLFAHHPDDGLLLRFLDGELPARKARQIQKHLEACWQCRAEVEAIQATVAECIGYRQQVLGVEMPAPPNPWQDLSRGFERIDASVAAQSMFQRWMHPPASLRWSLAAAAALAVVAGVLYQLRDTPSVQAATLLKRAVAASAAQPSHPARRMRFRSGSQQFVRASAPGKAPAALPAAMEAKFEQAHYDASDPLSARSFQSWRDSQARKQDEVSTVADPQAQDGNCYRIRTTTPEGEVAAATLVLRIADLAPVEGTLEFRDNEWIEFTELPEAPDASAHAGAADLGAPERPAVPPSRLAATPPRAPASISDELQVLSALHQIGADLGDPIQVTRSGGRILVTGVGVASARRQLIQHTLESMPNVAVQFSEPVAAPIPEGSPSAGPAPSGSVRTPASSSRIQDRLEERLGGRAELDRFTSQILDVDEGVMSRAYALRKLSQRFPAAAETGLSAADRRVLRDMAREHVTALATTAQSLQHALTPVLSSLGGNAPRRAATPGVTNWQASAEDVVLASRRVEVLLSVLLGVAPGQSSAQLPSDVLSALGELRADLDQCQQLLAQEGGG